MFITPAKWFLLFVILKNNDIRKIVITLRLRFEYLNGKRDPEFKLNIFKFLFSEKVFNLINHLQIYLKDLRLSLVRY